MVATRRGVLVCSPVKTKTNSDESPDVPATPSTAHRTRRAAKQSQNSEEESRNQPRESSVESIPSSQNRRPLRRCTKHSRLHSPPQPSTPADSDMESGCSALSDSEPQPHSTKNMDGKAQPPPTTSQEGEAGSEAESCSSPASEKRRTRRSIRARKTPEKPCTSQSDLGEQEASAQRATRSTRRSTRTRASAKTPGEYSELSDADSCASGFAEGPPSTVRATRSARRAPLSQPIPLHLDAASEGSQSPARRTRGRPRASDLSCDSEGFESGPSTPSRRSTRVGARSAAATDSDSEVLQATLVQSREARLSVVLERVVAAEPGEGPLNESTLEDTVVEDKTVTLAEDEELELGEEDATNADVKSVCDAPEAAETIRVGQEGSVAVSVAPGDSAMEDAAAEAPPSTEGIEGGVSGENEDVTSSAGGEVTADDQQTEEEPPTTQEAPPTTQEAPTTTQEAPPTTQEAPPTTQEAPPTTQEAPPTTQEEPPTTQEEPPTTQEEPPTTQEETPTTQEVTPTTQEELPQEQEVPPSVQEETEAASKPIEIEDMEVDASDKEARQEEGSDQAIVPEAEQAEDPPIQVTSSQEPKVKVEPFPEPAPQRPDVVVQQKTAVISLLDSSEEEEDDEEVGDDCVIQEEDDDDKVEIVERAGPSALPDAAGAGGLFMIDTRPGQEADLQYLKEGGEEEDEDEEEDFVDEEGEDDDDEYNRMLFYNGNPQTKECSTRIDPGLRAKELGGLYINFDGSKSKPVSNSLRNLKDPKIQDEAMKNSVLGPEFEKQSAAPAYNEAKRSLKLKRKEERDKSTGDGWFNMKAPELTPELKADLKVIKMRGALDPKRFYKKSDRDGLPKFFQVATVMDSHVDFFHSRLPKKDRKRTMAEELMADSEFRRKNKKKYLEIMAEKTAAAAGRSKKKRFSQKKPAAV
ncbi:deoxynucleotidyltransferase terminal-interacting protein 2 isoform X1 [Gadus morhua]|uniref:Deoxynucleotidyltransferase, terminal, interacting protein 2 n=1 Tax=Gadus morhua TaxID=8049 RepID=A0A8C5AVQ7_GADMO|nr:deoxynucleotidyltransferase terminal-interacting protein 2 isoform X1 [Gadus morhua]